MPNTTPKIEQASALRALMREWTEKEPSRANEPFVRVNPDPDAGKNCVGEYMDDTLAGRWDRQKIVIAVRQCCEEREWRIDIEDFPENAGDGPRITRASVSFYTGEKDEYGWPDYKNHHGESRCRAAAVLEAYLGMLSDANSDQ